MSASILRKARESADLASRFFEAHAGAVATCADSLAERLARGGRIFTMGNGGSSCDAQHIAVEFSHPIVEKRRAFPAFCLSNDAALLTAVGNDNDFSQVYAEQIALLARSNDAVIGLSTSGASSNVNRALKKAREIGALTIGFIGRDGGSMAALCDFPFVVPSWSLHRIQEVHTLLLHVLWDHVHVALGEDDVL